MIGNNTKLKLRMPFIFCIYSRKKYKDFNDIMRQCINQTMHKQFIIERLNSIKKIKFKINYNKYLLLYYKIF